MSKRTRITRDGATPPAAQCERVSMAWRDQRGHLRRGRYVKAPNAGAYDYFGSAVALSGDTLAVGANYESSCSTSISTTAATDDGCSSAGAAYVLTRTGATWSFQAYAHARTCITRDCAATGCPVRARPDRVA